MNDLLAKIEAAIAETERIAREAGGGEWSTWTWAGTRPPCGMRRIAVLSRVWRPHHRQANISPLFEIDSEWTKGAARGETS